MKVEHERHGRVALIRFENAPVNALSIGDGLVAALSEALAASLDDARVAAIVLSGGSRLFSAGADIRDFEGDPARVDLLRALIEAVGSAGKPVIAAIDGACFGGGLELALACHGRIASSDARFAFPEVRLGLLPGGGGTQRLPRLIGAAAALDMMTSARELTAAQALDAGLVDRVATKNVEQAAIDMIGEGEGGCHAFGPLPIPDDLDEAVAVARPRARGLAAQHIVDCVAAIATGPFEDGLAVEARLFGLLMASPESHALRHGFFARRAAARVPGLGAVKPRAIRQVAVVGGGLMGTGIALAILNAGLRVTLIEPRDDARARASGSIAKAIRRDVDKGRIDGATAGLRLAALSMAGDLDAAAGADLVIEAVFEEMGVKREVFGALDRIAAPDAILASNTSTLDLDAIAACTARPDRVVGLHFFSPANVMKLLEVVRGAATSSETLVTAMTFAKAIGKSPVAAGVCDGFVGNRMFEEYLRQAWFLLEEGALPAQLDGAMTAWGMAMGPCAVMDLAGQDIGWSIRKRRAIEQPNRPYSRVPDLVCELGRYGQKTGAGFYRYPDGRTAEHDPQIDALIAAESARIGLVRRAIGEGEIVDRCIFALVNEGAKILGEGIAYRPLDIDVVWLDGYGFPATRGGPMCFADQYGLPAILAGIERLAVGRNGWAWEPAPLLVELVREGRDFGSLNAAATL